MAAVRELIALDALGPKGSYRARARRPLADVRGAPVGELSLVPPLFVDRGLAALHRATPLPRRELLDVLARAARAFATGTVAGLSPQEYRDAVSRVSGLPAGVVATATAAVGARLERVEQSLDRARPRGAVDDWRDPATRGGAAVWTRRGRVLAVQAAGNHPGTHSLWPEALALGYGVAVRPSRREPFTPHRLISALREAGLPEDRLVFLPTDHAGADRLLAGADLGLVYGGQDVVDRHRGDRSVLTQGPGRSKILITADADWRRHLDVVVDSVSRHGGTGCVNATAVFVEGDPAPLCMALAARLAALPSLPPEHPDAVLPVQPLPAARALADHLRARAGDAVAWLGADRVVGDLGDGSAVLRPAVHELPRADDARAGIELPFPCVWVAPWDRRSGTAALRDSLVLTLVTDDDDLVDAAAREPSIRNLYLGDQPTYRMEPGLPHDGYLAEFLMRSAAVIRG